MNELEIRAVALKAAVARAGVGWSLRDILALADQFAAYIRSGEIPRETYR